MKVDTKKRKKARQGFEQVYGAQELAARMFHVLQAFSVACRGVSERIRTKHLPWESETRRSLLR